LLTEILKIVLDELNPNTLNFPKLLPDASFWAELVNQIRSSFEEHQAVKKILLEAERQLKELKQKTLSFEEFGKINNQSDHAVSLLSLSEPTNHDIFRSINEQIAERDRQAGCLGTFLLFAQEVALQEDVEKYRLAYDQRLDARFSMPLLDFFSDTFWGILRECLPVARRIQEAGQTYSFERLFKADCAELDQISVKDLVENVLPKTIQKHEDAYRSLFEEIDCPIQQVDELFHGVSQARLEEDLKINLELFFIHQQSLSSQLVHFSNLEVYYQRLTILCEALKNVEYEVDQKLFEAAKELKTEGIKNRTMMLSKVSQTAALLGESTQHFNDLCWDIVRILSQSRDLLGFLKRILNEDLRNLIDSVEEHSDQYIRVDTVSDLILVQRELKALLTKPKNHNTAHFVEQVVELSHMQVTNQLIPAMENCSTQANALARLYDGLANRGEVTKEIIQNILRKGQFIFSFYENRTVIEVSYAQESSKTVSYTAESLADFRSRALLISNSGKGRREDPSSTKNSSPEQLQEDMSRFVDLVDLAGSFSVVCDELCTQGEHFTQQFPIILDQEDLKSKHDEFSQLLEEWNQDLENARHQYPMLNYFTPDQLWTLSSFFTAKKKERGANSRAGRMVRQLLSKTDRRVNFERMLATKALPDQAARLCERIISLGELLEDELGESELLLRRISQRIKTNPQDTAESGTVSVVIVENPTQTIPVVLSYYANTRYLPLPSQFLLCNSQTTWDEIHLLLLRCFLGRPGQGLFCIAGVENLDFDLQTRMMELIDELQGEEAGSKGEWRLCLVCGRGEAQQHIFDRFSSTCHPSQGLASETLKQLVQTVCPQAQRVISRQPGLGKTEAIFQAAHHHGLALRSVPISGFVSYPSLLSFLLKNQPDGHHALHLDISSVSDPLLLNAFLFELLVLGSVSSGSSTFRLTDPESDQMPWIYVEIANTLKDNLVNSLPFCSYLDTKDLGWSLERLVASPDPGSHIQLVCNYLEAFERETLPSQDVKLGGPNPNTRILSSGECRELLQRYLVDRYQDRPQLVQNLSFNVVNVFVRVLAEQLWSFSESPFFQTRNLKDLTENPEKVREILFRNLMEVAAEFATRSVDVARHRQHQSLSDETMMVALEDMSSWAQSNHLVIAFQSQTRETISALYRDKKQVPSEVAQLMETQKASLVDYHKLPHEELLVHLERLVKIGNEPIKYPSYSLTSDNLLKMALIILRLRAQIPVIIMGETGCGKTSLIKFLSHAAQVSFYSLNIHAGTTQKQISDFVKKVEKEAAQGQQVWAFFDEINTCEELGLLNEIICHRRMLGRAIHPRVAMLAACNPYKKAPKNTLTAGLESKQAMRGKEGARLVYRVHPLPETMLDYIWDYGSLSSMEERGYIRKMVTDLKAAQQSQELQDVLTECLVNSQEFIRKHEGPSSVSLRDVKRCIDLISWFTSNLVPPTDMLLKDLFQSSWSFERKPPPENVRAIVLALSHCYHSRLSENKIRSEYRLRVSEAWKVKRNKLPDMNPITFEKILLLEQKSYLSKMEVPPGTAQNGALLENIFVLIVCILNRIPIFLVGKPGCSKSLSMQLIRTNLRGADSKDEFFKKLPQVYVVSYQGSESSTSEGILSIFEKAIKYQEKNDAREVISVVLLDEVGLAEVSRHNPLKVLHSLLEPDYPDTRPKVSVVGISNWALDAAKMNRAIHLSRPEPDEEDLFNTAVSIQKGCGRTSIDKLLLRDLAKAYYNYYRTQQRPNFHGLRDYYSLVKALARDKNWHINNKQELLNALDRNFGGLQGALQEVRTMFLTKQGTYEGIWKRRAVLELIEENLEDPFARHLMIISPGDTGLRILETRLREKGKRPVVLYGSRLAGDDTEEYSYRILNRIILCMETGEILILKDLDLIYGSLYDMLNQNYSYVGSKRNCRIALGAHSNPMCHVHEAFRCIVLMEEASLDQCDPPFLNRFEKQYLSYEQLLDDPKQELMASLRQFAQQISRVESGTDKSFVFGEEHMFAGYSKDLIPSLVLRYYKENEAHPENCCKQALLRICSSDGIVRAQKSPMALTNPEELTKWRDYYFQAECSQGLGRFLSSRDPSNRKVLALTYSGIHERIDLTLQGENLTFQCDKLNSFTSEKNLLDRLGRFFASDQKVYVLQCDPLLDREHISLAFYSLDKAFDEHLEANPNDNKKVCLLIHLHRTFQKTDWPMWKFDFMSTWKPVMFDSINLEEGSAVHFLEKSVAEILREEKFPFRVVMKQTLLWCLTCIKYPIRPSTGIERTQKLAKQLTETEWVASFFQNFILEHLESCHEDDWQVRIACSREHLSFSSNLAAAIRQHIRESVRRPLAKLLFRLEEVSALGLAPFLEQEERAFWISQASHLKDCLTVADPRGMECYRFLQEASAVLPLRLPFSFLFFREVNQSLVYFAQNLEFFLAKAQGKRGEREPPLEPHRDGWLVPLAKDMPEQMKFFEERLEEYWEDFALLAFPGEEVNMVRWAMERQGLLARLSHPVDLHVTLWLKKPALRAQLKILATIRTLGSGQVNLPEKEEEEEEEGRPLGETILEANLPSLLPLGPSFEVCTLSQLKEWHLRTKEVLVQAFEAESLGSQTLHFLRILFDFVDLLLLPVAENQWVVQAGKVDPLISLSLKPMTEAAQEKNKNKLSSPHFFAATRNAVQEMVDMASWLREEPRQDRKGAQLVEREASRFLGVFLRRWVGNGEDFTPALLGEILATLAERCSLTEQGTLAQPLSSFLPGPVFSTALEQLPQNLFLDLLRDPSLLRDEYPTTLETWLASLPSPSRPFQHPLAVSFCDFLEDSGLFSQLSRQDFELCLKQIHQLDLGSEGKKPSHLLLLSAVAAVRTYISEFKNLDEMMDIAQLLEFPRGRASPPLESIRRFFLKVVRDGCDLSLGQLKHLLEDQQQEGKAVRWIVELPWASDEKLPLMLDIDVFGFVSKEAKNEAKIALNTLITSYSPSLVEKLLEKGRDQPDFLFGFLGTLFQSFFLLETVSQGRKPSVNEERAMEEISQLRSLKNLPPLFQRLTMILCLREEMEEGLDLFRGKEGQEQGEERKEQHLGAVMMVWMGMVALMPPDASLGRLFRDPSLFHSWYLMAEAEDETAQAILALNDATTRYACPNGHVYLIGNCGQPMEQAKCPECHAPIGGTNHQLTPGNRTLGPQAQAGEQARIPIGWHPLPPHSLLLSHTVRSLPPLSFRIQHFLLHATLAVALMADPGAAAALKQKGLGGDSQEQQREQAIGHVMEHLRADWDALGAMLGCSDPERVAILVVRVLASHWRALSSPSPLTAPLSSPSARNAWEKAFNDTCAPILLCSESERETLVAQYRAACMEEAGQSMGGLEDDLMENNREQAKDPDFQHHFLIHLFRFRHPASFNKLLNSAPSNPNFAVEYPFLNLVLKQAEQLKLASKLGTAVAWVSSLHHHLGYRLKREEARTKKIRDIIEESSDPQKMKQNFDEFAKIWNSVKDNVIQFECKLLPYETPRMTEDLPVCFSLLEGGDEGTFLCGFFEHLLLYHNQFLEEALELSSQRVPALRFLSSLGFSGAIQETTLLSAKDTHFLPDPLPPEILRFSFCDPTYGQGTTVHFDCGQIEIHLANHLLPHRARLLLDKKDYFPFCLEMFHGSAFILEEVARVIPQAPSNPQTIDLVKNDPLVRNRATELLSSLNLIICFAKKTGGDPHKKMKNYCEEWFESEIHTSFLESWISNEQLGNLVSIYEAIEETASATTLDLTHQSYREELSEEIEAELIESAKILKLSYLLTALKRFSFRFLAREELNPKSHLKDHLKESACWPSKDDDSWVEHFPETLLLEHTFEACQSLLKEVFLRPFLPHFPLPYLIVHCSIGKKRAKKEPATDNPQTSHLQPECEL